MKSKAIGVQSPSLYKILQCLWQHWFKMLEKLYVSYIQSTISQFIKICFKIVNLELKTIGFSPQSLDHGKWPVIACFQLCQQNTSFIYFYCCIRLNHIIIKVRFNIEIINSSRHFQIQPLCNQNSDFRRDGDTVEFTYNFQTKQCHSIFWW